MEVALRHFEGLGEKLGFRRGFVVKQVEATVKETEFLAKSLAKDLNQKAEGASPIYDEIVNVVERHARRMVG